MKKIFIITFLTIFTFSCESPAPAEKEAERAPGFVVSFGCGILLVDWLDQFRFGGYPLGFFFAQQGAIYVFVALIFVYTAVLARLDARGDAQEPGEAGPASAPEPDDEAGLKDNALRMTRLMIDVAST